MVSLLDFVNDNSLFRQFKVNDLLFVEYKCVVNEVKLKIWSRHNYFIYVLSGKKVWKTCQGTYEVFSGQAIFVKKGANIVHQYLDKQFCSLIIFVPDDFIKEVVTHCDLPLSETKGDAGASDSVIRIEPDAVLSAYFQSVFAYFGNKERPPSSLLELKFKELILNIVSSRSNKLLAQYFTSLCKEDEGYMFGIMQRNCIYNLKLEEFARLCGRSLTSFKRDFIAAYKTTPGRWLARKKLEHAHHLLETTNKNINEVTFESGFENPSHFIKTFKQVFQMTPLEFRKTVQATTDLENAKGKLRHI